MPAIFIVDDDHAILQPLELWFRLKNYKVQTFQSGHNLIESIKSERPDIVLLDIMLHDEDGRHLCRNIKESINYPVKVLLFSANSAALLTYEDHSADGIINKPFQMKDLEQKCNRLLSLKRSWF